MFRDPKFVTKYVIFVLAILDFVFCEFYFDFCFENENEKRFFERCDECDY
jgi:hypothetical protein